MGWSEARLKRLKRWRGLSGFGGLVLASSFFMPAIPVCNSPFVPAKGMWDVVDDVPLPLDELAAVFLLCGAAYLFGLLTFIVALRSRSYRRSTEKTLGISISFLLGILIAIVSCLAFVEVLANGLRWDSEAAIPLLIILASLAYFLRGWRMGVGGLLCMRWYLALCCLLWFGLHFFGRVFTGDNTYYGLWLSLLGSLCIFWASFSEAQIRSRLGSSVTLWKLLRCKLELYDLFGPRCFECGYLLLGLTVDRCPECGQPFDRAEHGLEDDSAVMQMFTQKE